jgi:putative ATPase
MQGLGYGRGYLYPHDHPDAVVTQQYLPDLLAERRFYEPSDHGHERVIAERLSQWHTRPGNRTPRR